MARWGGRNTWAKIGSIATSAAQNPRETITAAALAKGTMLDPAQYAFLGGVEAGGWERGTQSAETMSMTPLTGFLDSHTRADLMRGLITTGAAAGGAAGGAYAFGGEASYLAPTGASMFSAFAPSVGGAAAGAAIGAGAAAGGAAGLSYMERQNRGMNGDGEAPPTLNEANDPDLSAQFQRMRKAARALGRAGTIKYKGAGNLGGSTSLGDPLALTGVGSSQA